MDAGIEPRDITSLEVFFEKFPFTEKTELIENQQMFPPYGSNLTYPMQEYCRFHQTSGTSTGNPMRWLDTRESWQQMLEQWQLILGKAGVNPTDSIFFAFSFGPFLGFWTAFEAGVQMGCLCIPGGGLSTVGRLNAILSNHVTVICCTPTYAIRLGEIARQEGFDLEQSSVGRIIVAGEAGGSIPATRSYIEQLWPGARVYDHHGMTEVGPVSFECPNRPATLRVIEDAYLPEILFPASAEPVTPGSAGELVLTTLCRNGSPLLRYRTGDLVQAVVDNDDSWLGLDGGILGRIDDMLMIRGVNLYPSGIEQLVRRFPEIAEFRVEVSHYQGMEEIRIKIEPVPECSDPSQLQEGLETMLRANLSLRIPVEVMAQGALPRFEMKAKRWVRVG